MLGDALLVAPALEPGLTSRQVYLPPGLWYSYDGASQYQGGQTITVPARAGDIPLFVRAGSVIPTWPLMQFVGEKEIESVTLRVYPGADVAASYLYEDDGSSLAYQQGDCRVTRFQVQQRVLRRQSHGPYRPKYQRFEVAVAPFEREPRQAPIDFDELAL
jgi:alpha-glucosidase